jgi:hypothetical protein|tara:strand:+ start:535 stop:1209 length:675 start_codon:yes stop_codon:yes gene_type:complete
MSQLSTDHAAIVNSTTLYQKNIHDAGDYPHKVLKPSTNKKLGRKITKGAWRGMPFHTLTLVERETCDSDCEHWEDCYGNNMPFAHRFIANSALTSKINLELDILDKKYPAGYVIRLHILGDFYSVGYVNFWKRQLANRPGLRIYGYTRHHPTKTIGKAVLSVRQAFPDTFKIRFSNLPSDNLSASSEHVSKRGIVCPVQLDKTPNCGACGLCWVAKKPIIFLDH